MLKDKKGLISRRSYLAIQCWIIFYDDFWGIFPLGKTCDIKSRKYKWYSFILIKVLHTWNFIKNTLHHGRSHCNFSNFSEFLGNFGADSEYRAIRLCAIIATYDFIFIFLKTHCDAIEIWSKTNSLCQTQQDEVCGLPLVLKQTHLSLHIEYLLLFLDDNGDEESELYSDSKSSVSGCCLDLPDF